MLRFINQETMFLILKLLHKLPKIINHYPMLVLRQSSPKLELQHHHLQLPKEENLHILDIPNQITHKYRFFYSVNQEPPLLNILILHNHDLTRLQQLYLNELIL